MNFNSPSEPRDFNKQARVGPVLLARRFSNWVSPPTLYPTLGFAICFSVLPFWSAVGWGTVYGVLVSLVPILVVLGMLKFGYVEELHMSNTRERRIPYLSAIIGSLLMLWLANAFELPSKIIDLALFNFINLTLLFLITIYWLISMHTAGAAAFSAIVGVIWGWMPVFLIGLPVLLSVTAARLYLRRHSPAQAAGGIILGFSTVGLMHWLGYFS